MTDRFRCLLVSLLTLAMSSTALFAQTLDVDDVELATQLSRNYEELTRRGRYDEAVAAAEQYAKLLLSRYPKDDHFKASLFLAEGYGYQGKYKEAIEQWDLTMARLRASRPRDEAHRQLFVVVYGDAIRGTGVCYDRLGDKQQALKQYELYVAYWEQADHPNARMFLAQAKVAIADSYRMRGESKRGLTPIAEALQVLVPLGRAEPPTGEANRILSEAAHRRHARFGSGSFRFG
ncbi:tetratricopeptide repeat protein [Anatilimnocola floriformis]|uniref:tetratricopeptide repeat protein n=1 Tax=Anatilimnocola floriformis TaxID=2948575 RepID=UPI0020C45EB2|nr:hypothetical protein [Anatilimnocola floriformis]